MEDTAVEEPEVSGAAEFAPVLVASHPHGNSVAVAIGSGLFDLRFGNWKTLITFMAAS
jgi:tRNA (guanine-N(7)-)-methyltransferase subunit TRM82